MVDNNNKGPIYGVELIDTLPLGGGSMRQQMPNRSDLERVRSVCERVAAGYEVLLSRYLSQKRITHSLADQLAAYKGTNIPCELKQAENIVDRG